MSQLLRRERDGLAAVRARPALAQPRRLFDQQYAVVADLNRYFPRQVVLDGEAKGLKFSGVLVVADEDAVLRRLEGHFTLVFTHADDPGTIIAARRSTPRAPRRNARFQPPK